MIYPVSIKQGGWHMRNGQTKVSSGLHMRACIHTHTHTQIHTQCILSHMCTHTYTMHILTHVYTHTNTCTMHILTHVRTHTNTYTMYTLTHMRTCTHTSIKHRKNTSGQLEKNPVCEGTQDTWLVSRVTATSVEGSGTDSEGEYRPAVSEQCVLQSQLRAFLLAH